MSTFALTDATVHVGGLDITTSINSLTFEASADELDDTTMGGGGYRSRIGGLKSVMADYNGYADHTLALDSTFFTDLGGSARACTASPTGADSSVAYIWQAKSFKYQPIGGDIGSVAPFNLSTMGADGVGVARGNLLLESQSVTGNVSGTGVQMGAVASGENVYTTIHVFTAGTTADVIVESDDNGSFSSATTRSSTTVTAAGGTWVTPVAGAISDDYWRVRTANVTGAFQIAAAVAFA